MSIETFAGGTASIASCGSKNPMVAMMAQMILSQNFAPLQVENGTDVANQSVGNAARDSNRGR